MRKKSLANFLNLHRGINLNVYEASAEAKFRIEVPRYPATSSILKNDCSEIVTSSKKALDAEPVFHSLLY